MNRSLLSKHNNKCPKRNVFLQSSKTKPKAKFGETVITVLPLDLFSVHVNLMKMVGYRDTYRNAFMIVDIEFGRYPFKRVAIDVQSIVCSKPCYDMYHIQSKQITGLHAYFCACVKQGEGSI